MDRKERHTRPAILGPDTLAQLENYGSFRHVVRNIYTFNLKLDRVMDLTEALPNCLSSLQHDLTHFMAIVDAELNPDS